MLLGTEEMACQLCMDKKVSCQLVAGATLERFIVGKKHPLLSKYDTALKFQYDKHKYTFLSNFLVTYFRRYNFTRSSAG